MRADRKANLWLLLLLAAVVASYFYENRYLRAHPLFNLDLHREVLHFNRSLNWDIFSSGLANGDDLWFAGLIGLLFLLGAFELYRRRK